MAIKKSDLYSSLWASCDELRGGMDASQYKDYVLFMLFIKYISDKYGNSDDFAPPVTIPIGGSFTGGEVFRSGCCFTRGQGRIFYFSPGHETYPVYYQAEIKRIISNAVNWVKPSSNVRYATSTCVQSPLGWHKS